VHVIAHALDLIENCIANVPPPRRLHILFQEAMSTGVMRSGIQLSGGLLDYTDANRGQILTTLGKLKIVSAAVLQQNYERDNF
jgi:hypothetical protein